MLNKILKPVLLVVFALVLTSSITSCQKAKDTIGVIIVKDINGNLIEGATVVLMPEDYLISPQGLPPNSELTKDDITDANGRAEFTYELEAILKVDVVKQVGNDVLTGDGVIRLLKEKTASEVIEIN